MGFRVKTFGALRLGSFWSRLAVLCYDITAAGVAFLLGVWIAHGANIAALLPKTDFLLWGFVSYATVASMVYVVQAQYRAIWRYTSLSDLVVLIRSTLATLLLFLPLAFILTRASDLPRSALLLSPLFMIAFLAGARLVVRMLLEGRAPALRLGTPSMSRIPAVVIGIDKRAESFVRDVMREPDAIFSILGLVAPDQKWSRRELHGVRVLGSIDEIEAILIECKASNEPVQRLILADDTIAQSAVAKLLEAAAAHGATLGRLPRITDLTNQGSEPGKLEVRPIALEDLLQRPQKVLDRSTMQELIAGKRVLVTGAGGSIGSELVRQIATFKPASVTLFDNSEYNLYAIDQELSILDPALPRQTALCDVRDVAGTDRWFSVCKPEIVFHAAAVKHVPLIEEHVIEGVSVNVVGTRNVAETSLRHGVQAMVMISTDKAVNPRNVMGATKRLAESFCQALDLSNAKLDGATTRFFTVRFGNVLGSTGSVVPLFQKQLLAGGPLTVTHPDITRYFMTIPEAVQLILQAAAMGVRDNGGRGKIFVLDMGEPIKIADLARQMIRLSGKRPDIDVKIKFIGLRPGEKLYEELLHDREEVIPSAQAGLLLAAPRAAEVTLLRRDIDALATHAARGDKTAALALLKHCVPEFGQSIEPIPERSAALTGSQ